LATLNLGILAHVDAGKTSLTERLLHAAGVIDEVGRVDDGNTQTDSLALERARGITIKSAVVSFRLDDVTVNLIDTPGHPDFIAEVERVLGVLDGVVLVLSAVEGVQSQTRVLMRTLRRLRIPTLIFVNKIDRAGARHDDLLREIDERITTAGIAMGATRGLGTPAAGFVPYGAEDDDFASRIVDVVTEHDDALLRAYVEDATSVSHRRLRQTLATQSRRALVHPVYFGSAITGAGIEALLGGVRELLPSTDGDSEGPLSGRVFKIERGPAGEKIAYVRMIAGTVEVRDRVTYGSGTESKVTALTVFRDGTDLRADAVSAGHIAKVWGLGGVRVGDAIGRTPSSDADAEQHFARPTLETVVEPKRRRDNGALHAALTQLAEQDPLIGLRQDDVRQELSVSLYGEVQKEVIQAVLLADYGIDVTFRETTTICLERPVGSGAAVEHMGDDDNPFRATVGLRVDPAPEGSGVCFRLEIELGSLPYSFIRAVEETVRETLQQGRYGWEVTDCLVTMTHSGYTPPPPYGWSKWSSSAGDFRQLTPLVLMSALRRAGTRVYEPMQRFWLEIPADTVGSVMAALARLQAVPGAQTVRGSVCVVEGEIPATRMHALDQGLAGLTRGEGVLESAYGHHRVVSGTVPTRPRTDNNPLDRADYLLRLKGRV
jgi:ribosomal protection tetracycline resistance protein